MRIEIVLFALPVLFVRSNFGPPPPRPAAGGWTTGAVGTLGDVVYGAGTHVIDLATTGLYDPARWIVILDYQSLTVQSGATVTFANHPTRAPVVIRAVSDILVTGTIALDGADGHDAIVAIPFYSEPGPGGSRGGIGGREQFVHGCAGLGPGGGFLNEGGRGGNGSHREAGEAHPTLGLPGPIYGSPAALPLIGGSGAAGGSRVDTLGNSGGGAGGGAILLGSDTRIELAGTIRARGGKHLSGETNAGGGSGSGGAIRIAAPLVVQTGGMLLATGGDGGGSFVGGDGGVRIETDGDPGQLVWLSMPAASHSTTLGEFLPNLPAVTLQSWMDDAGAWVPIGQDPTGEILLPSQADVQLPQGGIRFVRLEGRDVPLGATLHVRVTHAMGQAVVDSTHSMGEVAGSTLELSWTDVSIDFSHGVTAVQVRVELP